MTMTIERIYIASIDQSNAINATRNKDCTSKNMAGFYADCIVSDAIGVASGTGRIDFRAVNNAILERWPRGLTRIKNAAWRLVEDQRCRS
jgi:hypothetical protein